MKQMQELILKLNKNELIQLSRELPNMIGQEGKLSRFTSNTTPQKHIIQSDIYKLILESNPTKGGLRNISSAIFRIILSQSCIHVEKMGNLNLNPNGSDKYLLCEILIERGLLYQAEQVFKESWLRSNVRQDYCEQLKWLHLLNNTGIFREKEWEAMYRNTHYKNYKLSKQILDIIGYPSSKGVPLIAHISHPELKYHQVLRDIKQAIELSKWDSGIDLICEIMRDKEFLSAITRGQYYFLVNVACELLIRAHKFMLCVEFINKYVGKKMTQDPRAFQISLKQFIAYDRLEMYQSASQLTESTFYAYANQLSKENYSLLLFCKSLNKFHSRNLIEGLRLLNTSRHYSNPQCKNSKIKYYLLEAMVFLEMKAYNQVTSKLESLSKFIARISNIQPYHLMIRELNKQVINHIDGKYDLINTQDKIMQTMNKLNDDTVMQIESTDLNLLNYPNWIIKYFNVR